MIRVVVTGIEGQVVRALAARSQDYPDIGLTFLGRPEINLEKPEQVGVAIRDLKPDAVVSAAAYTAVDQAEDEQVIAMIVNGIAPGEIARAAADCGAPIIHLSTDYVFAGDGDVAYDESNPTGPVTAYGRTKLAGEQAIIEAIAEHVILRTAWVYSPYGKNFVKTMLSLAETRSDLTVVDDQHGNPTEAHDIADGIFAVLGRLRVQSGNKSNYGIFHMAGADETTWCGFANEIFSLSDAMGGPSANIAPTTSDAYPTKAPRPANSRLNSSKFTQQFQHTLPGYKASLARVLRDLEL